MVKASRKNWKTRLPKKAGKVKKSTTRSAKASAAGSRAKRSKLPHLIGKTRIKPTKSKLGKKPLSPSKRRSDKKSISPPALVPLPDTPTEPIAGVPSERQIDEVVAALSTADKQAFHRICGVLAEHLGSTAAARLWLITPSAGFVTTPLDAICQGHAVQMLEMLESQWGPSPTYA
jgi:hypothetical protein